MQIVTHTPERLVLRSRHTILAAIAWFSATMLVYGMAHKWVELDLASKGGMGATSLAFTALAIYFLRPSIFEFDRSSNRFRWTRPGLLKSHQGATPLDRIRRVRIDTSIVDNARGYRVLVETQRETVPFHHMYSSGDRQDYQNIVDFIRDWLES